MAATAPQPNISGLPRRLVQDGIVSEEVVIEATETARKEKVPLVEALESVAGATGNIVYEVGVMAMRDEVSTGQRLQQAMENTNLFPNMVIQMIAVGEESGSLDDMSAKVADFYEEDVDNAGRQPVEPTRAVDHVDPRRPGRRPCRRDVSANIQDGFCYLGGPKDTKR
jgi:hypothetical protein